MYSNGNLPDDLEDIAADELLVIPDEFRIEEYFQQASHEVELRNVPPPPVPPPAQVVIKEANLEEWDLVESMCEMLAYSTVTRMYPPLVFSVTGLNESKSYEMGLFFSRSEEKFKYMGGDCWESIWPKNPQEEPNMLQGFVTEARLGETWMEKGIDFSSLRISTQPGVQYQQNILVVKRNYLYSPKLVITAVDDPSEVYEYSSDKFKFVAMCYTTSRVNKLRNQRAVLRRRTIGYMKREGESVEKIDLEKRKFTLRSRSNSPATPREQSRESSPRVIEPTPREEPEEPESTEEPSTSSLVTPREPPIEPPPQPYFVPENGMYSRNGYSAYGGYEAPEPFYRFDNYSNPHFMDNRMSYGPYYQGDPYSSYMPPNLPFFPQQSYDPYYPYQDSCNYSKF